MAENSGIAWTTHTFNPWIGCTKVGPGCDHCYAEAWNHRFDGGANWGPGAPRRRTKPQNWSKVRKWQRDWRTAIERGEKPEPVRVFCASLADVFDNEVPQSWRDDLWGLIEECPDLDWIMVTKRVGNVGKMAPRWGCGFGTNVIVLSTIVNQAEADRDLDKLVRLKVDGIARHVGVSYEPALGPVDWLPWIAARLGLDWIIVGGESTQGGAEARGFELDWAYSTIEQCRGYRVPVFMKQLGSRAGSYGFAYKTADRAGADPSEWPADLRVREFPTLTP